jgi:hypothetical protein
MVAPLKRLRLCAAGLLMALASVPAAAESLRCPGGLVAEGDSRLSVFYKCGQPLLMDSFCAPVVYAGTLNPVPEAIAGLAVPCQPVEHWLYERGAGNLVATVHIRAGKVRAIAYGRSPR